MALEGNLATVAFPDLLQLLGTTRKTGTLHFSRGAAWKKFYVREGRLYAASSNDPDEFIGRVLVGIGKIDEADLGQALARQQREGKLVGKILVEQGRVDPEVLHRYLCDLAYEMVAKLMVWTDALFRFEEFALPASDLVPLDLGIEQLLMEGFRRADELSRLRELMPNDEVMLERNLSAVPSGSPDDTMVINVLRSLDEPRSIREVRQDLHAPEFSLLAGIARLIESGTVRARPPEIDARWLEDARKLLMAGLPGRAAEALRRGLDREPDNAEARALLARAESEFVREVTRSELPPETLLEPVAQVETAGVEGLSPSEAFLLSRLQGALPVASLLEMTPLPASEVLLALRRLLERGYVRRVVPPTPRP